MPFSHLLLTPQSSTPATREQILFGSENNCIDAQQLLAGHIFAGISLPESNMFRKADVRLPGNKATWKREFKLPWREAGPPNHHDDEVDSDQ